MVFQGNKEAYNFATINKRIMKIRNLIILTLIMLNFSSCNSQNTEREKVSDRSLRELAEDRRSIRRYTNEPVSREQIEKILKTATLAPSSYGQNPVEFVVVEDKETIQKLADCKRIGAPSVKNAPVAIVVMADTSKGELWVEDASVGAAYLMLAAEEEGLGACWNQIHLRDGQRQRASIEISDLLGIPKKYEVLCILSMGHKGENKKSHSADEMSQGRIHFGKFKN